MKKPQYAILDIPFPETAALERQVIADVIQSPDMMGDVLPLIHIDYFTNTERRGIWELLTDHYNKGLSFDMQTITAEIGKPFIDEILPHLPDAGGSISVIQHTNLLRTGAARRRAYCASIDFLQNAVNPKPQKKTSFQASKASPGRSKEKRPYCPKSNSPRESRMSRRKPKG